MEEKIQQLQKQYETEQIVSDRIRKFVERKTGKLNELAENQEKVKDKKIDGLEKEKDEIIRRKEEDEKEITNKHQMI